MTDRERVRQYLEDYAAGQIYCSARMTIDKDQIIAFAGQFDPQPYHLDEEAAYKSVSAAWRRAAGIPLRPPCDCSSTANSGPRTVSWECVDELRWLRPVRPGDSLYV